MARKTDQGWRPRSETIETAAFKKAHAAALEAREKKTCKHGHRLSDPNNIHCGTLMRTGKIMCNACWLKYAEKSRPAKKADAKAKVIKAKAARKENRSKHAVAVVVKAALPKAAVKPAVGKPTPVTKAQPEPATVKVHVEPPATVKPTQKQPFTMSFPQKHPITRVAPDPAIALAKEA